MNLRRDGISTDTYVKPKKNRDVLTQHVSEYHTKSGLRASCGAFRMEPQFFDSDPCLNGK